MSGGVFICYRREDSDGFAGRIYDRLAERLGRDNVFFDVDAIQPGQDFVNTLSKRVGDCDTLIAIIGKRWTSCVDNESRRRIEDPQDFVRIEVEAALKRDVPVIPVLVDGAPMPLAPELPDGLKELIRKQAVEISHNRFNSDVERLVDAVSEIERAARPPTTAPSMRERADGILAKHVRRRWLLALGLLALVVIAGTAWRVAGLTKGRDEWLTVEAFQADFNKKMAAGLYPDASSARCDGGVIKTNAHWAPYQPGQQWAHYNTSESAFVAKNSELTAQGYSLRYDNIFKDCAGATRHVALWTNGW